MDMPDLPNTTTLILHEQIFGHYLRCGETGEKNVGLVVVCLDYAYATHGCRDQLPSSVELEGIVSRAYDADNMVMEILDEVQGKTRPEGYEYDPDAQVNGYLSLVGALAGYLWGKFTDDSSESVSTPEKAQEYVKVMRNGSAEFSKLMLAGIDGLYDREILDLKRVEQGVKEPVTYLAGKTDAEIIAEASMPYKDTKMGKASFEGLKALVDDVIRYHRLP